jgi:Flp pilus assembly pilin Flp
MKLFDKTSQQLRQRGQGMTEYIVIVALVAVAAIGVYSLLGQTIRNQTAGLAAEIAGTGSQTQIDNAAQTAGDASTAANQQKGLANYNASNPGN